MQAQPFWSSEENKPTPRRMGTTIDVELLHYGNGRTEEGVDRDNAPEKIPKGRHGKYDKEKKSGGGKTNIFPKSRGKTTFRPHF